MTHTGADPDRHVLWRDDRRTHCSRPRRAHPHRPRAHKPHGQWAVDGTAPLNGNEEWKQDDNGLNVRERIETIYSKGGFDSHRPHRPARPLPLVGPLHAAQARDRRRQDRPLEPHELEDKYFMLRVRIDGGR